MNSRQLFFLIFIPFLCIACGRFDSVDLNIPESEKKNVIYAIGEVEGEGIVYFSHAYDVLEYEGGGFVDEISASYINNEGDTTVCGFEDENYGSTESKNLKNSSYQLAFSSEFGEGSTEFISPPPRPEIDSFRSNTILDQHGDSVVNLHINLNSVSENIQCFATQVQYYQDGTPQHLENKYLESVSSYSRISENMGKLTLNLSKRIIRFENNTPHVISPDSALVKVLYLSEDICQFHESLNAYYDNPLVGGQGYKFIDLYSNIPDGYGYFGLASSDSVSLVIE